MRYFVIASIAIALCITGCSSNNEQEQSANTTSSVDSSNIEKPTQKIAGAVADSLLVKLCRKWYSKKIVLHNIGEEYPTNNEELTLLRDMSYHAVDRMEDDSLAGNWQIISEKTIELIDQTGEAHRFMLTQLTNDSLVTKVLDSDEEDIFIHYSSVE